MKDETQKLFVAAIFALAAAYFLTHLHGAIAPHDDSGVYATYNTVTGKVTTVCGGFDCQNP